MFFVKLDARIEHASFVSGIHFQTAVVCCCHHIGRRTLCESDPQRPRRVPTLLQDSAGANFIEQDQRGSRAEFRSCGKCWRRVM